MVSPLFGDAWTGTETECPAAEAAKPHRAPRARRARKPIRLTRGLIESALLGLVLALLLVYAGASLGERLLGRPDAPVISVEVAPGDTLWTLAQRYGSPNDYILERVDQLARANGLAPGARLEPGQVIQVRVENPVERERVLVQRGK